jgi:hypothetical protein
VDLHTARVLCGAFPDTLMGILRMVAVVIDRHS